MAEAPRRRKAVSGLENLPTTEEECVACSQSRFSASTVTKEAFLIIRCIWPEIIAPGNALLYILETGSFFSEELIVQTENLFAEKLLGLDKLDTLFDIICFGTMQTPRQWSGTVADGLGPFSILVSLKKQITDRQLYTFLKDDSRPVHHTPHKKGYHDASQSSSRQMSISPTVRQAKRLRRESADVMDVDDQPISNHPFVPEDELSEETPDEIPNEIPDPRTPTETLVVDFMVNFIAGVAFLLQPLAYNNICIANAFETTYQFGPIRNVQTTSDDIQFRARIDGSIPFAMPKDRNLPEMAIFEAKRAKRQNKDVTVRGQQSMEHAAYIWKRHHKNHMVENSGTYHTFMVAQDYLSFYISIGTYNTEYLNYIFGPGDTPVVHPGNKKPFLWIQEFGPFEVDDKNEMKELLRIILCLLVGQLKPTEKGKLI